MVDRCRDTETWSGWIQRIGSSGGVSELGGQPVVVEEERDISFGESWNVDEERLKVSVNDW